MHKLTEPSLIGRTTSKVTKVQTKEEYLKSLRDLEAHVKQWYVWDNDVYHALQNLQINLLAGLNEINQVLRKSGRKKAEKELQNFLTKIPTEFDKFKKLNPELDQLSSQL